MARLSLPMDHSIPVLDTITSVRGAMVSWPDVSTFRPQRPRPFAGSGSSHLYVSLRHGLIEERPP